MKDLLSAEERKRAVVLLGMIVIMAFMDAMGVASILPFMAVLAQPDVVNTNIYLNKAYVFFGSPDVSSFMFYVGATVFFVLVASILFKAFTIFSITRYSRMLEYSIAKRFVALYLRQPYDWYLNRNSAELGKTVLDEVSRVVGGAIMPMLDLIAQGCLVLAMVLLLVVTNPLLACIGGLGMGLVYGLIYASVRHRLARYGEQRRVSNQERFQLLSEIFGGIKDVKVTGLEQRSLERFKGPAYRFAVAQGAAQVASQLPRYAMELLAFGGILAVVLYLMKTTGSLQEALPVLSLYALAGYRLMPSMQNLFVNIAALRFGTTTLQHMHAELTALQMTPPPPPPPPPVPLLRDVELNQIVYQYPQSPQPTLKGLSLLIPARSTIGFVGTTGSGKTTAVDVILGLLKPSAGGLVVDGTVIDDGNRRGWQSGIGYVPQHIFLADDSVAANIAFGVPPEQIDHAEIERAARAANLHDFVISQLPDGYGTAVGERGVRLSGGQRQRIGIARALYRKPQLLILDEATSALDNVTEQAVMEAVHALSHTITIILIAHRLSTVRECDCIYMLDQGQVVARGGYDDLLRTNAVFAGMVKAAEDAASAV